MDEKRGLERFLKAQVGDYDDALSEISDGEKQSHWIWYVFPQLNGLGMSWTSEYYGIADLAEVLDLFYGGKRDEKTLEMVKSR